jgi:hypothetical protein
VNAAYISATVAGAAVIVSGILQYLTLHHAKENAKRTVDSTERTARMTALASATMVWEQGLREDLAEFATLTYEVETAYNWAMSHRAAWPGEDADKVAHVEVVFNRILLRLNPDAPSEHRLLDSLKLMRDDKTQLWIDRRNGLVEAAVATFRARWTDNLDGDSTIPLSRGGARGSPPLPRR